MSETSGFQPKGEVRQAAPDQSQPSGFQPKGEIRRAAPKQNQDSGFQRKNETRRVSPDQNQARQRLERLSVQAAIFAETQNQPQGTVTPLEVRPRLQQSSDTCLLASVMAVKDAMTRRNNRVPMFDENVVAANVRAAGLLGNGGMATERQAVREQTEKFLEGQFGVKMDYIDTSDPVALGKACVTALNDKRVPLLNSSLGGSVSHWVSIYGMDKQADGNVTWKIADPLRPEPYTITTAQLSERLQGRDGTASQMFTVDVAEMRPTAYRSGTPSQESSL